jgi:P22 coat protein - gene protein 5
MTVNKFLKEIKAIFTDAVERSTDSLIMLKMANVRRQSATEQYRENFSFWRKAKPISKGYNQRDLSSLSGGINDMDFKCSINNIASNLVTIQNTDLLDKVSIQQHIDAMMIGMDSQVNISLLSAASRYGTLVVARPNPLSFFSDVAACDTLTNQIGIGYHEDKHLCLNPEDYNRMASDLASRGTMIGLPSDAYKDAYVGRVSTFDTKKLSYGDSVRAAGTTTATIDTTSGAGNYWIPVGSSVQPDGSVTPYDFRYQTVTLSSTASFLPGDAFTIAGVYAINLQSKMATTQLKTFRVISVNNGTQMTISPSIISAQGNTKQEINNQNVDIVPSSTAALTLLNKNAAPINPFFCSNALELYPGTPTSSSERGSATRWSLSNKAGINYVLMAWDDPLTYTFNFRLDGLWGVNVIDPEKAGILIGGQA